MSRYLYFALIAVLAVTMFSATTQAQAPPSADTYVSSFTPKTNYGFSPILVVQPGATTFIQFDLAALPAGASVNKATLRLYVDAVVKGGSFDVFPVDGAWSENTLTYNTPPPSLGASATGNNPIAITSSSSNQFFLIDITPLAQGWVNGTIANNGVALSLTTSNGIFSFDSKESLLTGNGPELEIVLNGPAGPQGIPGIAGPTGPAGPQGPQGLQGTPGSAGIQGAQGLPGPAGAQGTQGATGPQGLQGFSGPQGPQGPQGVPGINNLGTWNNSNTYNPADAVYDAGSYWIAVAPNTNSEPSPVNTNWQVLAAGINNRGPWASTNNYNVNDAVSDGGSFWLALAADNNSEPAVGNTQWQQVAAAGTQGAQGPAGAAGATGPAGPAGPAGLPGAPGMAASIEVGTTTTVAPGTPASVSNVGTPNAAILNFSIPQGEAGAAPSGTASGASSVFSAFLPGPLSQAYTAAYLVPDIAVTITRISAAQKTQATTNCEGTVLRLVAGSAGQDVSVATNQFVEDTGPMSLPVSAGTPVQVQVRPPAQCTGTNPADTNVLVEYRGQQSGDTQVCAQPGLVCSGICEQTQSDANNCGGCGNACGPLQACNRGTCINTSLYVPTYTGATLTLTAAPGIVFSILQQPTCTAATTCVVALVTGDYQVTVYSLTPTLSFSGPFTFTLGGVSGTLPPEPLLQVTGTLGVLPPS